jgi:hypothetical protein
MSNMTMYFAFLLIVTLARGAFATPTAYCTKGVSKPCGQICISESKTCRKSWTTAVIGTRPATAKKGYETPKFVNEVPR